MGKSKKAHGSRPCGSSATIKEQISTSIVCPVIVVSSKNILVPRHIHRLIIDVQPSFTTTVATTPCAAITVRVEYMERVVSTARGHTVVVEHTIERVARGLSGSTGSRGHDIYTGRITGILSFD